MDAQGMEAKSHLMEFFGRECPHCAAMAPLVARLQEEEGIEILTYEVWHSEQNATRMREIDQGRCGGVPFFYNPQTGKWLCGMVSYEKLKDWALGK
jgi:thiol-disulfide isomerase/thioredoxin